MKTSLAFLGILSTVVVASHSFNRPLDIQKESAEPVARQVNAAVWKLSISGIDTQCTASFTSKPKNLVFSQNKDRCDEAFPDLRQLAGIQINANGDITIYHQNGSKLGEFMETESAYHESFWPALPLMTLARID
jgi:hypothetical protein